MYEDTRLPCTLCLAPPGSPRPIGACPRRWQRGGRARTRTLMRTRDVPAFRRNQASGCAKGGRVASGCESDSGVLRVPGRPLDLARGWG